MKKRNLDKPNSYFSMYTNIKDIPSKELFKGIHARFVHAEGFTLGFVTLEEGAELPEHAHIHEQSTLVTEGRLAMTIDGVTTVLEPGMSVVIPSNVKHSAKALTSCKVNDTFCPVREDYK